MLYKSTGRTAVLFIFFRALSIPLSFSLNLSLIFSITGNHHQRNSGKPSMEITP
jgi:hypothetical protein